MDFLSVNGEHYYGFVRTRSAEVGGNDGKKRNAEGAEQLKVEASE